jgi:CRISPR/Cas system type I-B associated protein Csh2 (Cas7 group RAMP superfamily)
MLKGVLAAQQAELAGLSAERAEAAAEVLVQQAANATDLARQEQAELELRVASVRSALRQATRFLQADSRPVLIPNPNSLSR